MAELGGGVASLGGVWVELRCGDGECDGECLAPPATDIPEDETDARYWAIVAGRTDARLGSKPGNLCEML